MLNYLICYISLVINEENNRRTDLSINLDRDENNLERYKIIIIAKVLNPKNKNIRLDYSTIFFNIIKNIGFGTKYSYKYISEDSEHQINISLLMNEPNSIDISQEYQLNKNSEENNEPSYYFKKKRTIKEDNITCDDNDNSLVYFGDKPMYSNNNTHDNNLIFINVEDEIAIQGMHTLVFAKKELELNCVGTGKALISMLLQVYSNDIWNTTASSRVVVLLDHFLDGTTGLEVYREARLTQQRFGLNILWILVSSTEDNETIENYTREGIHRIIDKPLTITKLSLLLDHLDEYDDNKRTN